MRNCSAYKSSYCSLRFSQWQLNIWDNSSCGLPAISEILNSQLIKMKQIHDFIKASKLLKMSWPNCQWWTENSLKFLLYLFTRVSASSPVLFLHFCNISQVAGEWSSNAQNILWININSKKNWTMLTIQWRNINENVICSKCLLAKLADGDSSVFPNCWIIEKVISSMPLCAANTATTNQFGCSQKSSQPKFVRHLLTTMNIHRSISVHLSLFLH